MNFFRETAKKAKHEIKELAMTWQGWLGYLIANIITSVPWFSVLVYGFITQNKEMYVLALAIYGFMSSKIIPFWAVNILIAIEVRKLLVAKKKKSLQVDNK